MYIFLREGEGDFWLYIFFSLCLFLRVLGFEGERAVELVVVTHSLSSLSIFMSYGCILILSSTSYCSGLRKGCSIFIVIIP